jgi:hypothetical protein
MGLPDVRSGGSRRCSSGLPQRTHTLATQRVGPGQIARIRSRRYLVEEVVLPPKPGDQTLVRAACLDDDAQGDRLEVLWEKEVDAEVLGEASWKQVAEKGFDAPPIFSAYLLADVRQRTGADHPRCPAASHGVRSGLDARATGAPAIAAPASEQLPVSAGAAAILDKLLRKNYG